MLARELMSTGSLTFLPDMGLEARATAERGVAGSRPGATAIAAP